jgi:hypothetical protein
VSCFSLEDGKKKYGTIVNASPIDFIKSRGRTEPNFASMSSGEYSTWCDKIITLIKDEITRAPKGADKIWLQQQLRHWTSEKGSV